MESERSWRQTITGWTNYFKLADMKRLLIDIDQWMRRRIRMIYWKQWKKIQTKYKNLKKLGLNHENAIKYANTRKGYWRVSNSPILSTTLDNNFLRDEGFIFFSEYYKRVTV